MKTKDSNQIITPKQMAADLLKIIKDAAKGDKKVEKKLANAMSRVFINLPFR